MAAKVRKSSNSQKEKTKFRNTVQWKRFKAFMKKKDNNRDQLTGRPLRRGWQLHHLDMSVENYKDLNPDNFVCLNRKSHELIHFLFNYDTDLVLGNARKILLKMEKLNKDEKETVLPD